MPMTLGEFVWARADGEGFGWEQSEGDGSLGQESCLNKAVE